MKDWKIRLNIEEQKNIHDKSDTVFNEMEKMIIETKIFKHITYDHIKKYNDYFKSENITIKWHKDISSFQVILSKSSQKFIKKSFWGKEEYREITKMIVLYPFGKKTSWNGSEFIFDLQGDTYWNNDDLIAQIELLRLNENEKGFLLNLNHFINDLIEKVHISNIN